MAEVGSVMVRIGAETAPFERSIAKVTRLTEDFGRSAERLGSRLSGLGGALSLTITAPIVALGASFVSAATEMDSLTRGLTAMTGSAAETQVQLARLKEVAKLPGLGFREAIEGSINLQAAGFSARSAEAALSAFGNALATVGRGKDDLNGVILALTQIVSLGKVTADNINQISNRVPQMRQAMVAAFGTADTMVLQKRNLSVQAFVQGITAQLAKLPQVTGGARNAFENLDDAAFRLRAALGQQILPVLTPLISKFADFAQSLSDVNPAVLGLGVRIVAAAATVGPLLFVIGKVVQTVGALLPALSGVAGFLAGPWGVAVAVAAAGLLAISTNFLGIGDAARTAWEHIADTMATVLPPTLALMRRWTNLQIGYLVGLGRAGAVVFDEMGDKYSAMLNRVRPLADRLGLDRVGGVVGQMASSTATSVRDLFTGNSRAFHLFGGDPAPGIAEQFNLGAGPATKAIEVQATDFGGRVRQAFMSGFDRDFVGEAGDALSAAIDRMRAALSARGGGAGGGSDLASALAAAANAARGPAKQLADQADALAAKFKQTAKDAGDAWKDMLRHLPSIELGPLPRDLQENLTGIVKRAPDNKVAPTGFKALSITKGAEGGGDAGSFLGKLANGAGQLLQQFTPMGLAFAAISKVLEPLQPLIDALLVPMRIFGEIIAAGLVPVLRLLFPIIKAVTIVLSYLQEAFDRVIGTLLKGIGWFVRGLGKVINALDPFGNPGNPLVKLGEAMRDTAGGFFDAADEIAKKRKELEGLSFSDAMDSAADSANKLSEALINAAQGFKIDPFRFAATDAESVGSAIPRSPPSGPRTDTAGASISMPAPVIQINGATDPDGVARMVVQALNEWARSYPHMRATVAGLTP